MLALIAFIAGLILSVAQIIAKDVPDDKLWWALAFLFTGLALAQLPYGPRWPRNGPQ